MIWGDRCVETDVTWYNVYSGQSACMRKLIYVIQCRHKSIVMYAEPNVTVYSIYIISHYACWNQYCIMQYRRIPVVKLVELNVTLYSIDTYHSHHTIPLMCTVDMFLCISYILKCSQWIVVTDLMYQSPYIQLH